LFGSLPPAFSLSGKKEKPSGPPVFRWNQSQPGCTFSTTSDGKYEYAMATADLDVVMAVDARELQVIRHRIEPVFGVLLTIRYRGNASLDFSPEGTTLQFMKHFKLLQPALDPDDYTDKIQTDSDRIDDETRRFTDKHPEKKDARAARQQDYEKSITELIEFLARNSLRPAHFDPAHAQANGWIFFDTANKWLGGWKAQEEFILRLPVEGVVLEFPFKLPPKKGELLMRTRE
jgi:hypothetical protein